METPPEITCHVCDVRLEWMRDLNLRAFIYSHPGFPRFAFYNRAGDMYGDAPYEVRITDRELRQFALLDIHECARQLSECFRSKMSRLHNDVLADSLTTTVIGLEVLMPSRFESFPSL
mgnify:CR=1 FL=1